MAKVVYYGPSRGGKTTSLRWLHQNFGSHCTGQLFALDTHADQTLFFDLMPMRLGTIGGFQLRLKLYTVPGQIHYNITRKMVLTGTDAIVFVADSTLTRHEDNLESLRNLEMNLNVKGLDIRTIPMVFQYNKRDLSETLPLDVMDRKLNFRHLPSFGSIAIHPQHDGVLRSFIAVIDAMLKSFERTYGVWKSSSKLYSPTRHLTTIIRGNLAHNSAVGSEGLSADSPASRFRIHDPEKPSG
ncbi:gliding-motility protein MglA [candidate division KSB3 bacterium]|uniref:Gliding-motility protein MglA n=1 Tax=candidate division KSB3 bacterium TaxID=2044937 RepID=A0A9D5K0S6_9BACT|nr:gliding-motility protein MglA [candidate division KSB3 bacterium]MBD3327531.1 gliding-motility protein MglA [candidate division KSB3 bacterium]